MQSSLSTAGNGSAALLRGRTAADDFCRRLPAQDPIVAQRLICAELQRLHPDRAPEPHQLGALLTLDRHAAPIGRRLAARYVEGNPGMRGLDRRFLTAALRLCGAFADGYAHMLRHIEQAESEFWRTQAATVLVLLFRHRQQEFLLRLFRYKKRNSEQWRQLHEGYRFALARGVARERPAEGSDDEATGGTRTLEREFISILLLDALNTGQFSPRDLLRANALIERCSEGLNLQPLDVVAADRTPLPGFVVDLDGTEGLNRPARDTAGTMLHLVTAPLMRALDAGSAGPPEVSAGRAGAGSGEPLAARLRVAWAPTPVHIRRRGERAPVDQTVVVVAGISSVVHLLRLEALRKAEQRRITAAPEEGITIAPGARLDRVVTNLGRQTEPGGGAGPATRLGAIPQPWQVKDRSDSGCRMRGQTDDLNALIPGSLVALAPHDNAAWTIAVVRRLRRLMVDHVEVSVEYIGRRPRFVKVTLLPEAHADTTSDGEASCYGALYLPASDEHPRLPIKSLLVPACVYAPGVRVTLLSSSATYALELSEPLRQHADFVWTSFTVLDKGDVSHAPIARRPGLA
jgi:hypothetical protein